MSIEGTSSKSRTRRIIASAAVLLGILGSMLAAPSAAHANTGMYRFEPIRICVPDIEDWWPDDTDEVRLRYGYTYWGASIRNGSCAYPPAETFTGSTISVNVYENDRGYDNQLGTWNLLSTDLNREITVTLGGRGASFEYFLVYRIVAA